MARVNIEECWWSDPRRSKLIKLVGSEEAADGLSIKMWRLAQEFWGRDRALIPVDIFETIEANAKLIQAKLAEVRDGGIYVRGSSQYLDWHAERREAGRIGGLKSAEKRSKTPKQTASKSKQTQPSDSGSHSLSVSGSSSGSVSLQKTENPEKANAFIAAYCELFKLQYGINPIIKGKEAGIAKRLAKEIPLEKQPYYLEAFFSMPDAWLHKTKHPLSSFELKLNEISVFAATGNFTTSRQVKQADDAVSNTLLLQQVRAGKI